MMKNNRLAQIFVVMGFLMFSVSATTSAQGTLAKDSINIIGSGYYFDISSDDDKMINSVSAAVLSIVAADLVKSPSIQLLDALQGRISGLGILRNSGEPGIDDRHDMMIRGHSTLRDNSVLVLVDGFETLPDQLSLYEIESVSVLKDAAATAQYGLKGANGVLYITTRRGAEMPKTEITFNARHGIQSMINVPEFATMYDYVTLYNEARANDGLSPFFSPEVISGFESLSDPYLYPEVNWYDRVLKEHAPLSEYSLSFRGGGTAVKYFTMLGYANTQGFYADTDPKKSINSNHDLNRFVFRSNVDIDFNDNFSVILDISGRLSSVMWPNYSTNALWRDLASYKSYPAVAPNGIWAGAQGGVTNPVASVLQGGYRTNKFRQIDETLTLKHKLDFITTGLSAYASVNFSSYYRDNYDKKREYSYYEIAENPTANANADSLYILTKRGLDTDFSINQTYLNQEWNRTTVRGGIEYIRKFDESNVSGYAVYHQDMYMVTGDVIPFAYQQVSGKASYDYAGRYFLELTGSYSGSDNYLPGERFGFFPAVSAAWNISNESFITLPAAVNNLKVRASIGTTGNGRLGVVDRFSFQQYYYTGSGIILGSENPSRQGAMFMGTLAYNYPTWEKSRVINLGLETYLFNGFSLEADYFDELRSDIFVPAGGTIPMYFGAEAPYINMGSVKNRGFEIVADYRGELLKFRYFLGGQFSYSRSTVLEKNEQPREDDYRWEMGHPVSQFFGLEAIGFFESEEDILESPVQYFGAVQPGDIKYKDLNDDKIIDERDIKAIGYPSVPEIQYSFYLGGALGGFDLYLHCLGIANRSVYLNGNSVIPFIGNAMITGWAASSRWTEDNTETATFPRLTTQQNDNNYRLSTFWLRDGSFFRINNIEFGYTIPDRITDRLSTGAFRIYFSVNNPLYFHKIDEINIDPELMNINTYPLTKSIQMGAKLQF
jgi:TonB-linked SusC/RagA family outer membrane protein